MPLCSQFGANSVTSFEHPDGSERQQHGEQQTDTEQIAGHGLETRFGVAGRDGAEDADRQPLMVGKHPIGAKLLVAQRARTVSRRVATGIPQAGNVRGPGRLAGHEQFAIDSLDVLADVRCPSDRRIGVESRLLEPAPARVKAHPPAGAAAFVAHESQRAR